MKRKYHTYPDYLIACLDIIIGVALLTFRGDWWLTTVIGLMDIALGLSLLIFYTVEDLK